LPFTIASDEELHDRTLSMPRVAKTPEAPSAGMADHFRDGAAAIRQPFCVYGADERLVAYNQAFADLHLRLDGTCLLHPGIAFQDIMEWRKETGFFAANHHEKEEPATHEHKLRLGDVIYQLADGRWMVVDNTPLPDGRLACIWSDITAVKEAERQLWELTRTLHRSQDHLYCAQRVAHVGSIEFDLRTGQVIWTPEMYQIFGRDPNLPPPNRDEAPKLFHPEDRARYRTAIAAEPGTPAPPAVYRVLRPDGQIRWVHREADVIRDDAGEPWLRVGTYRDVTEIHEYQERQKALQAELLGRERLSAIGSVTERLARELRDPLSTITYSLFLIKGDTDQRAPASDRALGRIERSAERCNQIISDLLEYSHSGLLRPRPHDLNDWLREVVAGFAIDPGVVLELDLQATCMVEIDPGRLRRALGQVLENAVQAAISVGDAERSPLVTLCSRLGDTHAEIAIIDNGPGIAPEALDRAFDPLFSTKRFGTGLGLTTARQIVEQHGGTIDLESRVGEGTSAVIRLPIAAGAVVGYNSKIPSAA
jgi:signal transduction histidine kinase